MVALGLWVAAATLTADDVLGVARAVFRAHERPPFIAYTVRREERVDGLPAFADTYVKRVWCRAADGAAIERSVRGGVARGELVFERVRFDADVDPGPPTADLFQPAPPRTASRPQPAPAGTAPPEIASAATSAELEYRAEVRGIADGAYDLRLEPRRDPDRNRLRELWVDASTFELRRVVAVDRLYDQFGVAYRPDSFDMALDVQDGVPLVRRIVTRTLDTDGPVVESTYTFENVLFDQALPSWYFEPASYGAHRDEAPS